MVYLENEHV